MAAEGGAIVTFIFNGESSDDISRDVTHLIIHENITVIPERLFWLHPNLVEVYCHAGVTKIEARAFGRCPSLRRAIITGVTIVEECTFLGCVNLLYVECDKLERIGESAFSECKVLGSINLPSAKILEQFAFSLCPAVPQVVFGKGLESIRDRAFNDCRSLESVTMPLKNGLLTRTSIFRGCDNLNHLNLIAGKAIRDFADALLFEDWKNDMNEVLDSINLILPNIDPGGEYYNIDGGKARAIRDWIGSVLRKVTHYKAAHCELLNKAAATLQLFLPNDAVMNSVLPFVELPANILDEEDEAEH